MQRRAFVIMPFDDEFDEVYNYLIQAPLLEAGYDVMRADNILHQRNILESIIDSIKNSDLIVADLSMSNPNVYYELGLAHAYRKDVILIAQEIMDIPFDLRSYRIIVYSNQFARMNKALEEFKKFIEDVQSGNARFGSPVTDFDDSDSLPSTIDTEHSAHSAIMHDDQDERGLIDHQIEFEQNMGVINDIVFGVGRTHRSSDAGSENHDG